MTPRRFVSFWHGTCNLIGQISLLLAKSEWEGIKMNTILETRERTEVTPKAHSQGKLMLGMKVGFFLLLGIACSGYMTTQMGHLSLFSDDYAVYADFQSVAGLREGAEIEISGVRIGYVGRISLTEDSLARVELLIRDDILLPDDSTVSVRSRGLVGNKIISIFIGGSIDIVPPNGVLLETESGKDLEDLLGKLVFGAV